jgi:hypothetical protein
LVVSEKDPESLGNGEDELSVGKGEQEVVGEVVGEQEGTFLRAGGAEAVQWPALGMETLAGKGDEEIVTTFGIRTLDAGDALGVIAATEEPFCHLGDTGKAEEPELLCEEGVVLFNEV